MLLPNTPLQRTRVAPRRSPLNGLPLGGTETSGSVGAYTLGVWRWT
jgi:hypothetical protein